MVKCNQHLTLKPVLPFYRIISRGTILLSPDFYILYTNKRQNSFKGVNNSNEPGLASRSSMMHQYTCSIFLTLLVVKLE